MQVRDEGERVHRLDAWLLRSIASWLVPFERARPERFDLMDDVIQELKAQEDDDGDDDQLREVMLPTDTQILITREFDVPKHRRAPRRWTSSPAGGCGQPWQGDQRQVDLRVGGSWRQTCWAVNEGFQVAFHGEFPVHRAGPAGQHRDLRGRRRGWR